MEKEFERIAKELGNSQIKMDELWDEESLNEDEEVGM